MPNVPEILVVGSVNMDLVVRAPHMPAPGETVLGRGFATCEGGKGANQAVAAAKLGGSARIIARVGDDAFGGQLLDSMRANGVDCRDVMVTRGWASGTATSIWSSVRRSRGSLTMSSGG